MSRRKRSKKTNNKTLKNMNVIAKQNEEKVNKENTDYEQRRSNRLGAIIGILALIGAILIIVFNILINAINAWPLQGYTYQYMQFLFVIVVTSIILLIFRAVTYCYYDLKRHNIMDLDHVKYDIKSDQIYFLIIEDVKIYFSFMIIILYVLFPIQRFEEKNIKDSILGGIFISIPIIFAIAVIYFKRKSILTWIVAILKRLGFIIFFGFLVYYTGFLLVTSKNATLSVVYGTDGNVKINNESGEYTGFKIYIYDLQTEQLVWTNTIKESDVFKAKEVIKVNDKVSNVKGKSEGVLLNSEILFSSCEINLDDLKEISLNKQYYILIISEQEGKSLQLINTFTKDKGYTFAQDKMMKQY
ncbi:hypothetical protein AALB39_17045 [Lachnospiraceae bacterium 54-53]